MDEIIGAWDKSLALELWRDMSPRLFKEPSAGRHSRFSRAVVETGSLSVLSVTIRSHEYAAMPNGHCTTIITLPCLLLKGVLAISETFTSVLYSSLWTVHYTGFFVITQASLKRELIMRCLLLRAYFSKTSIQYRGVNKRSTVEAQEALKCLGATY